MTSRKTALISPIEQRRAHFVQINTVLYTFWSDPKTVNPLNDDLVYRSI